MVEPLANKTKQNKIWEKGIAAVCNLLANIIVIIVRRIYLTYMTHWGNTCISWGANSVSKMNQPLSPCALLSPCPSFLAAGSWLLLDNIGIHSDWCVLGHYSQESTYPVARKRRAGTVELSWYFEPNLFFSPKWSRWEARPWPAPWRKLHNVTNVSVCVCAWFLFFMVLKISSPMLLLVFESFLNNNKTYAPCILKYIVHSANSRAFLEFWNYITHNASSKIGNHWSHCVLMVSYTWDHKVKSEEALVWGVRVGKASGNPHPIGDV